MIVTTASPGGGASFPAATREDARLMAAAQKLEAAFLSEMLRAAEVGTSRSAFGGGAGEEQFASFLRDAQAEALARQGDFGLAQSLFEALKARSDAGN